MLIVLEWANTNNVFSRLNAHGGYLKISSFDPVFFLGWRLIGVQRLIEKIRYIKI